jgi:hypothetical protein
MRSWVDPVRASVHQPTRWDRDRVGSPRLAVTPPGSPRSIREELLGDIEAVLLAALAILVLLPAILALAADRAP